MGRFASLWGMPLFEYVCQQCGRRFEAFVTGGRTAACPGCGSSDLEKLVSAFARAASGRASGPAASPFT